MTQESDCFIFPRVSVDCTAACTRYGSVYRGDFPGQAGSADIIFDIGCGLADFRTTFFPLSHVVLSGDEW